MMHFKLEACLSIKQKTRKKTHAIPHINNMDPHINSTDPHINSTDPGRGGGARDALGFLCGDDQ
jgi:hypothetical protein